jgi:ABC-type branched-subunit amino acid transport system ATPase component
MIEVSHIGKTFDGIIALDDVEFTIEKGKITALIGPNGAGKTTIFNIITGFMKPDNGQVKYKNKDITNLSPYRIANLGIARTFQVIRIFEGLSVLDNVLLSFRGQPGEKLVNLYFNSTSFRRREREISKEAMELLNFVNLIDKRHYYTSKLSYGEQKLLSLVMCLATGADILLLDEPVAGVDLEMFDRILTLLEGLVEDKQKTVCFIEHYMEAVAKIADTVVFMDEGKIIKTSTYEDIVNSQEVLKAYME